MGPLGTGIRLHHIGLVLDQVLDANRFTLDRLRRRRFRLLPRQRLHARLGRIRRLFLVRIDDLALGSKSLLDQVQGKRPGEYNVLSASFAAPYGVIRSGLGQDQVSLGIDLEHHFGVHDQVPPLLEIVG
ncbi:MAG: hypothetical protein KKB20_29175, partial [Proteobacteria bacterium]|nr:hypothetical protein [Pseudomonadota bacterium]